MAIDPAPFAAGRLTHEAAGACLAGLFEEHGRMVYGVCRLMLRDRAEAEDAAQQTFLSAHRSLLNGTELREPGPWLATIARNECRARMRARMPESLAVVDDSYASASDIEGVVAQRAEIAALCAALAELPAPQRDAIVLREFYGLSYEEVSAVVGVSTSAVDALLVRARRRLQAELRPARLASGMVVVPVTLMKSLAQSVPGFATGGPGSGVLAKLASLPIAAKLMGAATTVAVVAVVGSGGPSSLRARGADESPPSVVAQQIPAQMPPHDAAAIVATPARSNDGDESLPLTRRSEDRDDEDVGEGDGPDPNGGDGHDVEDDGDRGDPLDGLDEADVPDDDGGASNSNPDSGSDEVDEPNTDG